MTRSRAVRTAWYAGLELDAYLRQRAWHWTLQRNYALSADYCIRLLNRHPQDPLGLVLGEVAGRNTHQEEFTTRCSAALQEGCKRKQLADVDTLVAQAMPKIRLPNSSSDGMKPTSLLPSVGDLLALRRDLEAEATAPEATETSAGLKDESLTITNSEPLSVTQQTVRRAGLRCSPKPLVELLEPEHSVYGRGLYATEHIPSRQAILCESPFVVQRYDEAKCAHCLAPLSARVETPQDEEALGVPCPQCEAETYCSVECRDAAWAQYHACSCASRNPELAQWAQGMRELLHQRTEEESEAGPVNSLADVSNAGSEARAALSCLTVSKLCAMATVQQVHPLALPGVSCLRGVADYEPATALSEIGALAVALSAALRQPNLYMEEMLSLFALLQTNEFFTTSGVALYAATSLLNHSCDPNCALVSASGAQQRRKPTEKYLVALRPIRAGEQLLISYNANLTTKLSYEDRKALCAQRHFECFCPRCIRRE